MRWSILIENLSDIFLYKEDLQKGTIKYKPKFHLILREDMRSIRKKEIERKEFNMFLWTLERRFRECGLILKKKEVW